jgi:hypothetical protein
VAQGEGPEFKSQYHKKRKIEKEKRKKKKLFSAARYITSFST